MSDSIQIVEIIFLAMLAGFVALRLVSVLGRRTGHEKPATDGFTGSEQAKPSLAPSPVNDLPRAAPLQLPPDLAPATRRALEDIAAVDPRFEPVPFVDGARAAYRMILEAFWQGNIESVKPFIADDVLDQFRRAIAAREAEGLSVDNRLVSINKVAITEASLQGAMAEVTVRVDATLSAVTRDRDGNVVAGSASAPVETHDVWTFSRHTRSPDPNWLLIATDAEG
ncbi:Tim44/TimA family putative adaptor protein [Parapedomonas caeni]|jgi:predicted lipid-binding transport protein (Tim44 family)